MIDRTILRRKLGKIAKGKAPGYSGDGPDFYAAMPDGWVDWAVKLANIIQFTQITPAGWHIDLVNYVHKGCSDSNQANGRTVKGLTRPIGSTAARAQIPQGAIAWRTEVERACMHTHTRRS